jgi:hypothetical protein
VASGYRRRRRIVTLLLDSGRVSGVKTADVCLEGELEELSRTRPTDRRHDIRDVRLDLRPTGSRENANRKPPAREILLVAEVLIRSDERVEHRLGGT